LPLYKPRRAIGLEKVYDDNFIKFIEKICKPKKPNDEIGMIYD
jgi:hypothetical protein